MEPVVLLGAAVILLSSIIGYKMGYRRGVVLGYICRIEKAFDDAEEKELGGKDNV